MLPHDAAKLATLLYRAAEEGGGQVTIAWAPRNFEDALGLTLSDWEERDEYGRVTGQDGGDQRALEEAISFLNHHGAAADADAGILFVRIALRPQDDWGGPPPWEQWWDYGKRPLSSPVADFIDEIEASLPQALAQSQTETQEV